MNPLFFPGAISQFISVIIFFVILAVFLGMGGYIYYQKIHIDTLKQSLRDCETQKSVVISKSDFLAENLKAIQSYCSKRRVDIFDKQGKLLIDKIFQVEPR